MIYGVLPVGSYHGWGVCGKYISSYLAGLTDFKLITKPSDIATAGDAIEVSFLKSISVDESAYEAIASGQVSKLDGSVLQAITGANLRALFEHLRGDYNVGYTFFEDNLIAKANAQHASQFFDLIVSGSSWCEHELRDAGVTNVTTIIQGVDTSIFNPCENQKSCFTDKFVVFSGGKFELRKGQDIVIKAFKALHDKYKDTLLVCSWYNAWHQSAMTMSASPYIKVHADTSDFANFIRQTLVASGLDLRAVIVLPPYPNAMMARIYKNTDIGLFPNRCEGGTNLVLMEYMACAKPVIASFSSGHRDILTDANSIKLTNLKPVTLRSLVGDTQTEIAIWDEPDLDEAIDKLIWAYNHRESLNDIASQAGEDLGQMTWQASALMFFKCLNGG